MAKINFGGVVQDARGKQNGLVYSKNGSGSYVRRKVTPVNPQTPAQQNVRSTLATLSQHWSGLLTDAQRAAWTLFAKTYPITDIFGASVTLNGLNMYVRVNACLANAGLAGLLTPPSSIYTPVIPVVPNSLEWLVTGGPEYDFEQAAAGATGILFYLFSTPALPPGRTPVRSDYRFLGTAPQQTTGFPIVINDQSGAFIALFGTPAIGLKVSMLISSLDPNIGIPTVGQAQSVLVT